MTWGVEGLGAEWGRI